MSIKSIPDNQGWSAGGYNFYVAEDGNLTKGRPGEIPTPIGVPQEIQDFADTFTLPATDGTTGQALVTNGAGALSFATMSLPDGATIGGVMYFNRPTKPTVRSAGVPLVVRDRWYNTSDGTEWFWNGTYWLSPQKSSNLILSGIISADTYQAGGLFNIPPTITSLLFVGAKITAVSSLPINPTGANGESDSSTNYWTCLLGREAGTNNMGTVYTVSTQGITVGTGVNAIFALEVTNQPIAQTVVTSYFRQRVTFQKTGNPPNLNLSSGYGGVIFYYHWIA